MRLDAVTRPFFVCCLVLTAAVAAAQETSVNFIWSPATPKVGEVVTFLDTSHVGPRTGAIKAWRWSFGDGTLATAQNVAKIYGSPGQMVVTLFVTYENIGEQSKSQTVTVTGEQLQAAFSWSPGRPLANQAVSFADDSGGSPTRWRWQFGDGSGSTTRNPVHTYARPGNYIVSLMVENQWASHMLLKQIRIYDPGPSVVAKFDWTPSLPAAKQPVTFRDRSDGKPVWWQWDMGDGTRKYQQHPGHTYARAGTYQVTLTVSDGDAPSSVTQSVTVADVPKNVPVPSFNFNPSVGVVRQPVAFFDTSSGSPTKWLWDFGDGVTSTLQNPVHAFAFAAGGFRVTLTVTNADGSSSAFRSVEVREAGKAPVADFWYAPYAPVQGQTVTFTDSSKNDPTSVTWTIDGSRYTGRSVSRTYTGSGTSTVTLTASNAFGSNSVTRTVTIAAPAQQLSADFTWSPAKVVAGQPVTFTNKSLGNPTGFQWYFGDGGSDAGYNAIHTFNGAGTFNVSLAANRGTESDSVVKVVKVQAAKKKPAASFVIGPSTPTVGKQATLVDTSANEPESWHWEVDGKYVSSDKSAPVIFNWVGLHTVRLTVANAEGSDSTSRAVKVDDVPPAELPVIYSVRSRYGRCFIQSFPIQNDLYASVNWKGTAGSLFSSVNGGAKSSHSATADGGTIPLNTNVLTGGIDATSPYRNVVSITAQNSANATSTPLGIELFGYPKPSWLVTAWSKYQYESDRASLIVGRGIPAEPFEADITLPARVPFFGGKSYGIRKTQATYEYTLRSDCTTSAAMKGEGGLKLGNVVVTANLHGGSDLTMTPTQGLIERKGMFGLEIAGNVEGEVKLGDGLNAIYPGAGAVCDYQLTKKACELLKIKTEIKVAGGGDLSWTSDEKGMHYADTVLYVGPEAKVALVGKVNDNLNAEVYGGGKFGFFIGWPSPGVNALRKFEFVMEAGYQIKAYVYNSGNKIAAQCASEKTQPIVCGSSGGTLTGARPGAAVPLSLIPPESHGEPGNVRNHAGESDLFALSAPAAAATQDGIVAVYLHENAAAANQLHRTDVHYVTRSGMTWSAPKPIASDDRAEFSPQVATRSDGKVVAVWQRARSATLVPGDIKTFDDLPKLNAQMEIATSTFDPAAGTWSTVEMLTSNEVTDYGARLVPLSDGSLWAVWLRDDANLMYGSSAQPLKLVARKLTGTTWAAEQQLATGFVGAGMLGTASRGTDAIVAWDRDKDGNAATTADTEIAYVTLAGGSWSASRDLTSDASDDAYPLPLYLASGAARVTWLRGGQLVWQAVDAASPAVLSATADGLGLPSRTIARSPNGSLAMLWTDRIAGTPEIVASLYVPATGSWSEPARLTRNEDVESSLSAFLGDDLTLTAVALSTRTAFGASTAVIDGQQVTIPAVASAGASDLALVVRQLIADIAALPGGISASNTAPAAGEQVTLTVKIENRGDLPLRDVPWRLVAGRGTGGTTMATGTVAGLWAGGVTRSIEVPVVYAAGMTDVTFVLDPDAASGDATPADNASYYGFANRPPTACMQLSAMAGLAPMTVAFDAACSADAEGPIAGYSWTFGDGDASSGSTASHTFATEGTWPVTLTVSDDSGRATSRTVEVYVGTLADLRMPTGATTLNVPVAGRTSGAAGTFFLSDATLFNADATETLGVSAVYMPDRRSDFYYFSASVPPSQLLDMPDLVAGFFGAPAGAGWVKFDLSHTHAVLTTRSYNKQPGGTAGTAVPAVPIEAGTASGERRVFLQDWRSGYRVNVGAAEIGGEESDVTFTAYDAKGALLGSRTYRIPAFGHTQVNSEPQFQGAGRIDVTVDGGIVVPYLTTVDGKTGDAVYQGGVPATALVAGERWMVPTVAHVGGALSTSWRTDVRVYNADASSRDAVFTLVTPSSTYQKSVPLSAGETKGWDDVVATLFPEAGDTSGVLFVDGAGAFYATSRTYNDTPGGTYGLTVPARRASDLPRVGEVVQLVQLRSDTAFRCNLGISAFDDSGASIAVRAYDATGTLLAEKSYGVGPRQNRQINRIFADLGITANLSSVRLEAEILTGRPYVFASVVDNQTGDGTFIEAAR